MDLVDLTPDDPRWETALLAELERRAVAAGCSTLDLDSGVQRFGAHRFYLRERLAITAHHFGKSLGSA